jgi:cytochrome c-type biogenesis protein CcmH
LIAPAGIFLLIAGIGAAASNIADPPEAAGSAQTISDLQSPSGPDGEILAHLDEYARSIGVEQPAPTPADGELLPDVSTMIERLAARLEAAPGDVKGWGMLGWSYSQMERYEQAAAAYAKALELDPSSTELKRSYEEAKAKAANGANTEATASLQTGAVGKGGEDPSVTKIAQPEPMSAREREAQIRSMVDGLATRLESFPRDVEGWTRLMRSRVVLGEPEVAATAFRRALEVFKDDTAASSKITAAAIELGLKAD